MLNTPATYGIYIAGLVFQWLKKLGRACETSSRSTSRKASLLYDYLDQTEFYHSPVARRIARA